MVIDHKMEMLYLCLPPSVHKGVGVKRSGGTTPEDYTERGATRGVLAYGKGANLSLSRSLDLGPKQRVFSTTHGKA